MLYSNRYFIKVYITNHYVL